VTGWADAVRNNDSQELLRHESPARVVKTSKQRLRRSMGERQVSSCADGAMQARIAQLDITPVIVRKEERRAILSQIAFFGTHDLHLGECVAEIAPRWVQICLRSG